MISMRGVMPKTFLADDEMTSLNFRSIQVFENLLAVVIMILSGLAKWMGRLRNQVSYCCDETRVLISSRRALYGFRERSNLSRGKDTMAPQRTAGWRGDHDHKEQKTTNGRSSLCVSTCQVGVGLKLAHMVANRPHRVNGFDGKIPAVAMRNGAPRARRGRSAAR